MVDLAATFLRVSSDECAWGWGTLRAERKQGRGRQGRREGCPEERLQGWSGTLASPVALAGS